MRTLIAIIIFTLAGAAGVKFIATRKRAPLFRFAVSSAYIVFVVVALQLFISHIAPGGI